MVNYCTKKVSVEPLDGVDFASSVIATLIYNRIGFLCEREGNTVDFTVLLKNKRSLDTTIKHLESPTLL